MRRGKVFNLRTSGGLDELCQSQDRRYRRRYLPCRRTSRSSTPETGAHLLRSLVAHERGMDVKLARRGQLAGLLLRAVGALFGNIIHGRVEGV
jgi:hypothetical protein